MTINKLTDTLCRKATATDKPRKISGLFLWVSPTGAKIWRIAYRQYGKEGTEVLGPYPLLTLADVRNLRDKFRRKLLDGVDVKAEVKKPITFQKPVQRTGRAASSSQRAVLPDVVS